MDEIAALNARLERLERSVETLTERLAEITAREGVPPPATSAVTPRAASMPAPGPTPAPAPAPRRAPRAIESVWRGELWLDKLGIALLVLGVGFLGKYSIDRGWITPAVRVAACFVIGAVLFGLGVRLHARRRRLAQSLLGGGLAVFYVTGYIAFQLYALVPHGPAFAFLSAVTVLAFLAALRQDEPVLAIVGTIGGLATPFLLYTNAGTIAGLVAYTSAIVVGTSAIHAARRWFALVWTSLGGTALVLAGALGRLPHDVTDARTDRIALQLGLVLFVIAYWALPISLEARHLSRGEARARAPRARLGAFDLDLGDQVHLLPVAVIAFALGGTNVLWSLARMQSGGLLLGGALLLGVVTVRLLADGRTRPLGVSHALATAVILTWALDRVLPRHAFLVALGLEGLALHALARRFERAAFTIAGHVLFTGVALWTLGRLAEGPRGGGAAYALANLTAVLLLVAAAWLLAARHDAALYGFAAHVGWLLWLWRTLGDLPSGNALVTAAWGLHGALLLPIGVRAGSPPIVKVAFGTIIVAVVKLVLFDLAHLDPIWRIGLFIGFGAALLVVSYLVPSLWRPASGEAERPGAA